MTGCSDYWFYLFRSQSRGTFGFRARTEFSPPSSRNLQQDELDAERSPDLSFQHARVHADPKPDAAGRRTESEGPFPLLNAALIKRNGYSSFVFSPVRAKIFVLNEIASNIAFALNGETSVQAVAESLKEKFSLDFAAAHRSVLDTVSQFEKLGIVTRLG